MNDFTDRCCENCERAAARADHTLSVLAALVRALPERLLHEFSTNSARTLNAVRDARALLEEAGSK